MIKVTKSYIGTRSYFGMTRIGFESLLIIIQCFHSRLFTVIQCSLHISHELVVQSYDNTDVEYYVLKVTKR